MGWSWYGGCGDAHGVFGELNVETVHFVWDGVVFIATIVLRIHFRKVKNIWLTLSVIAAGIHQIEHIYLEFIYLFMRDFYSMGGSFLGILHIANGTAAAAGIMGHNGIVGTAIPPLNVLLPGRINLHFIYNVCVFIPMVLAFRKQLQYVYDEWLAKAMPQLSEEQLIAATAQSENAKFAPGEIIFRQSDPANKFYIITKGQVDVTRVPKKDTPEIVVGRLSEGQYFGEIELLGRTERSVTAKAVAEVECLTLNYEVFKALMIASSEAQKDMDLVLRRRIAQLGVLQGIPAQDSANADPDTVMKTRMIRDRLKLLQGDEVSRILGRTAASNPQVLTAAPAQSVQSSSVAVAERPAPETTSPGFRRGALLVRNGPSAGMRYEISAPRIIVGRRSATPGTDTHLNVPLMQVDDGRVSRHHVEIVARPDGLYVRDLGSANGTWLNGSQLGGELIRFQNDAELRLGPDTVLNYQVN